MRVNADDELYMPEPGKARGKGATELEYDEFEEIVCRICREKIPEVIPEDGSEPTPFEQTLDTWLGLFFIPALRNCGKAQGVAAADKPAKDRSKSLAPGGVAEVAAAAVSAERRKSTVG